MQTEDQGYLCGAGATRHLPNALQTRYGEMRQASSDGDAAVGCGEARTAPQFSGRAVRFLRQHTLRAPSLMTGKPARTSSGQA